MPWLILSVFIAGFLATFVDALPTSTATVARGPSTGFRIFGRRWLTRSKTPEISQQLLNPAFGQEMPEFMGTCRLLKFVRAYLVPLGSIPEMKLFE